MFDCDGWYLCRLLLSCRSVCYWFILYYFFMLTFTLLTHSGWSCVNLVPCVFTLDGVQGHRLKCKSLCWKFMQTLSCATRWCISRLQCLCISCICEHSHFNLTSWRKKKLYLLYYQILCKKFTHRSLKNNLHMLTPFIQEVSSKKKESPCMFSNVRYLLIKICLQSKLVCANKEKNTERPDKDRHVLTCPCNNCSD